MKLLNLTLGIVNNWGRNCLTADFIASIASIWMANCIIRYLCLWLCSHWHLLVLLWLLLCWNVHCCHRMTDTTKRMNSTQICINFNNSNDFSENFWENFRNTHRKCVCKQHSFHSISFHFRHWKQIYRKHWIHCKLWHTGFFMCDSI